MENTLLFLYQLKKNLIMAKPLHINLNLLIVIDLCKIHYQILLIIHLKFLIVKNLYHAKKEKKTNSECSYVGLKNDRLIYKCKEM